MFKRKLFKRALPIILSVAMVFQSAPTTAFAAEGTTEPETVIEETTDEIVVDDGDDNEAADGQDDGANEETDAAGTTEAAEEATAAETQTAEETTAAEETEAATKEASDDAETETTLKAEIKIDQSGLYEVEGYDSSEKKVVTTFDDEKDNPFKNALSDIKNWVVSVDVADDDTEVSLKNNLTYTWQAKGEDGSYKDMAATEVPVNAGAYRLVISLDASLATAESVSIDFEIEKAVLEVFIDENEFSRTQKSGITVKEIKDEITDAAVVTRADEETVNPGKFKNAIKPLTITVRESAKKEALADETVLKKGNDYSVDVVAELTDDYKANYDIEQLDVIDLNIADLRETKVTITNNLISEEKEITRVFNGEKAVAPTVTGDKPEISVEVTVVGEEDEATGKDKVLLTSTKEEDYAKLTKTWYDADHHELEDAPIDAGVYFYEIKYTDAEGIYAESKAEVKVVIETAQVILKPALSVTEYLTGATASDVTSNVTYTLTDADGKEFEFDPETFWGVSYNNPVYVQSYAPVFKLQMGETRTVDGKTETTWTDVEEEITEPSGVKKVDDQEVTISYRLVPKGTKALFEQEYEPYGETDINATDTNSAEKNYEVDLSADVIEKNAVAVTVKSSVSATIDVSAMIPEGMQKEDINSADKLYTKIYDGDQLYEDRAAYKKAVVKDANGNEIVKDTDDALTYTWYKFEITDDYDEEGNQFKKPVLNGSIGTHYDLNPYNAGKYALEVSYYDESHEYAAEPVYIYFEIEAQLIKVIPDSAPDVYADTATNEYLNNNSDAFSYKVYAIPGNDLTLTDDKLIEIAALDKESNAENNIYWLNWYVLEGDNIDKDIAKFNEYEGIFKSGVPYKLAADLTFRNTNAFGYYGNFTDNYEVVVDEETVVACTSAQVDINVKPMGSTELEITVDDSKLTANEKVYDGKGFDLTEAIANGLVKVTKKNTDEVVPITGEGAIALTYDWYSWSYNYAEEEFQWTKVDNVANVGTYEVCVSFNGDDTYKVTDEVYVGDFTITPRELTVTPVLKETITAGLDMSNAEDIAQVIDVSQTKIEGYIEEDAEAFAGSIADAEAFVYTYTDEDGYKIVNEVKACVKDENGSYYAKQLRTGKTYIAGFFNYSYFDDDDNERTSLRLNSSALKDRRAGNYDVVVTPVKFQTNKRGNSQVYAIRSGNIDITRLKATYNDMAATIVPVEGIPYSYEAVTDEEGNQLSGNFFTFKITAPAEYLAEGTDLPNSALYENSIKKAGGYILGTVDNSIIVAFDAAKPEQGDNTRSFEIRWEDGYVESFTVDFTNAELEEDLTIAVAPKSLAFNGVDTKMIAGECQQLDVKLTKYQIDDVVCLNYEVTDGKDVVSVTNKGYVTALSKGTATISVYPVRYDRKGNMEKLNFKAVTTRITVSDVSAPKVAKPYAYDYSVEITYTKPADGYRREIYILPGKLKATDFESKIAEMNQGEFADDGRMIIGVPEYSDDHDYHWYDEKTKQVTYVADGLAPNTEYTVYVRNVSGMRTIDDGSFVTYSKSGNVQTFQTTKEQAKYIGLYFDEKQPVTYDEVSGAASVKLSDKSVQITAEAGFNYKPENVAADNDDAVYYDLPLAQAQKDTYVDPKLSFYAVNSKFYFYEKKDIYTLKIGDRYYQPSQIAKVDKKGNIKLNGVGGLVIIAYDSISKIYGSYQFEVTSDVTKMTAKAATLKVGQHYDLTDSLTFYDGKTKLKGVVDRKLNTEFVSGDGIELTGTDVYVTQPNKTVQIKVSLADKPEVSVTATVKTKALDAVKSLKASNIMDADCDITFTHSASDCTYRIEIRNGRNALVRTELVDTFNGSLTMDFDKSNFDKNIYAYTYHVDGLVRKSDYKISVTPVCGTETAKTATVKVKTTDIPAWHGSLLDKDDLNAGMDIYDGASGEYVEDPYFTSGMSYTFKASADTPNDGRATDTLTWKSSNTKVATVKAVPNTYTATFTALKAGYTDIEVSSKLRKGVIARWRVRVKAVGAAGDAELGDFEEVDFDPYYEGTIEELTENNPVRVVAENGGFDYTWVKFRAPAYGYYTFSWNGRIAGTYYEEPYNEDPEKKTLVNPVKLNEGDTVFLKAYGSFVMRVSGEKYQKLTTTTPVNSSESSYVVFTAPEDNYYTFEATQQNMYASYTVNDVYKGTFYFYNKNNTNGKTGGIALEKGDVVTFTLSNTNNNYEVSVKGRATSKSALSTTAVSTGELKKGDEVWYTYTAPVTGSYNFKSTEATGVVKADFYRNITDATATDTFGPTGEDKDFEGVVNLVKDDTVLIRVYTESTTAVTAKVSVVLPAFDTVVAGTAKDIKVAKNGETWVSFEVDEDDTMYSFKITGDQEKNTNVTASFYKNNITSAVVTRFGNVIDYSNNSLNKKDIVYIKLTTDNTTDDSATVKVLVTKRTATAIAAGESKDLTVENNGLYFYEFTAPSYGLYVFESKVTANADGKGTHKLVADQYDAVNSDDHIGFASSYDYRTNDFYKEAVLSAGEKVVFAVRPTNVAKDAEGKAVTTQAKISVTQVTAETLPGENITFAANSKGAAKWYKFIATADDEYTFKKDVTSGTAEVTYGLGLYADIAGNLSYSVQAAKGESIYFKVVDTSDSETSLKLTVTGKKSSIQEIPAAAFDIKGGETVTYKYTVKKAGRYKVDFKSNTEGINAIVDYGTDSALYTLAGTTIPSGKEIICPTVGMTYYFDVTTNNTDAEKKASVSLSVAEIQPTAMEGEKTVTVKPNEPQWFAYTVPATGRYIFTATTGEANDDYNAVRYYYDLTYEYYDAASEISESWLKKDEVIYIRVDNTTAADASVKLSAKQIVGETVTAGTAKEIELKKGETKWYQFTADADAYYAFKNEPADGMSVTYKCYKPGFYEYSDNPSAMELDANETILIKVTRTDSAEAESMKATLTITKRTYTTLKEKEDLTITVKNGENQYIEFIPPKTGYYEFYVKEVPNGVTVTSDAISGEYDVKRRAIAQKVTFSIGAAFTSENADETKSFKLYAAEVTPVELTTDKAAEVSVAKNQKAWFTFTAPEDGRYVFSDDSATVDVEYGIYTDDSNYGSPDVVANEYPMSEGDEIRLAVSYKAKKASSTAETVPASASFKLSASKIEPTAITASETSVELESGASKWYSYTAAKTGEYTFTSEGEALTFSVYGSMADVSSDQSGYTLVYLLAAGDTIYLKIENKNAEKKTVKVNVAFNEAIALAFDAETEAGFTAEEIAAGTTMKYLAFKAPKTGYYKFTKTDGTLTPYIIDKGYFISTYRDNIFIKEGNTLFVRITSSSVATVKIKVENGTTEFSCETIAVDQQKLIELEAGENRYLEFTAPSTGTYSFFSTSVESSSYHDSCAYLYNDMMEQLAYNDDGNGNLNFKINRELKKGQTVYLMVKALSDSRSISFNVFVKEVK